jgi:hypothetical protein
MQYATRLKAYSSNPVYDCVFNPLYENVYDIQPNTIQTFGIRVKFPLFFFKFGWHSTYFNSWKSSMVKPKTYLLFWAYTIQKSETNPLLIQQHLAEIISVTTECSAIYTDGSQDGNIVASAAVFGQQVYSVRLPSASSIFRAEANAIHLALKFIASSDKSKFMICSDYISCLLKFIKALIPSHIGIHGNTVVDQGAKNASDDPVSNCSIPYADFKTLIMKYILKHWQDSWDQQIYKINCTKYIP